MPLTLDPDADIAWRMSEVVPNARAIDAEDILSGEHELAFEADMEQLSIDYLDTEVDAEFVDNELWDATPNTDPHTPRASLAGTAFLAELLDDEPYSELANDRFMM